MSDYLAKEKIYRNMSVIRGTYTKSKLLFHKNFFFLVVASVIDK